jgi:hypothetical protein
MNIILNATAWVALGIMLVASKPFNFSSERSNERKSGWR